MEVPGAAESLRDELTPFNIHTLIVHPGFFRTLMLSPANTTFLPTTIPDYESLVQEKYAFFRGADGTQPMDPVKGVERIVDVVKGEGGAKGREMPGTFHLGKDVIEQVRGQSERVLEGLGEWEGCGKGIEVGDGKSEL